jgi:endopolyphosphatase
MFRVQFLFLEEVDLDIIPEGGEGNLKLNATGANDGLYETLMEEFSHLPKESEEEKLDGLAVINEAPSVVPNPYVPGLRIFSYNVSSEEVKQTKKRNHGHQRGRKGDKDKHCKEEPYRSSWKCHLSEKWYSDADAPSRKNQQWTPLGYAQVKTVDWSSCAETD